MKNHNFESIFFCLKTYPSNPQAFPRLSRPGVQTCPLWWPQDTQWFFEDCFEPSAIWREGRICQVRGLKLVNQSMGIRSQDLKENSQTYDHEHCQLEKSSDLWVQIFRGGDQKISFEIFRCRPFPSELGKICWSLVPDFLGGRSAENLKTQWFNAKIRRFQMKCSDLWVSKYGWWDQKKTAIT